MSGSAGQLGNLSPKRKDLPLGGLVGERAGVRGAWGTRPAPSRSWSSKEVVRRELTESDGAGGRVPCPGTLGGGGICVELLCGDWGYRALVLKQEDDPGVGEGARRPTAFRWDSESCLEELNCLQPVWEGGAVRCRLLSYRALVGTAQGCLGKLVRLPGPSTGLAGACPLCFVCSLELLSQFPGLHLEQEEEWILRH